MGYQRPELHAQTALRGLAAMTVFIAHAGFYKLFPQSSFFERLYQVFFWHNVGVDLFFELSGFVLCYVYLAREFTWTEYFRARFARIYPLYLLGLLALFASKGVTLLKTGTMADDHFTWPQVTANFLLLQDWPLLPHFSSINWPTWSISVEIFLYIALFPLLYQVEAGLKFWPRLLLAGLPVMLLGGIYLSSPPWVDASISFLSPFRGILCFTSGFFACRLGLDRGFRGALPRGVEVVFLILTASSLLFEFPLNREAVVMVFPILVYIAAQQESLLTRLTAIPLLIWLGDLSYSIYVWHYPVLKTLQVALGLRKVHSWNMGEAPLSLRIAYIAASLIGVLGIAHLSHYYFERPVGNWLRKVGLSRLKNGPRPAPASRP